MKLLLVLMMTLSSFGALGRDYFKSIDDVMSDSPYCLDNKLGSGIGIAKSDGSFQGMPPGYFCEKCKDDAKKKRIKLKRTTNLKDAYGKGSKDKQTDNHYRCLPPKTKDPFVCAVKVGKTKVIAVKVKDGVMPQVGSEYAVVGTKTFESKSDAKKSEECKIEVKYVCVREIGKKKVDGVKVEDAKKNASKYEVIGTTQFDSKKKAKNDPACDPVAPKYVCVREIGKKNVDGVTVEDAKTNASKYEVIGTTQFDSKKEAKKDPACDPIPPKYVCAREIGKKKVEGISVEEAKTNASKYEVIGTTQFDSKKQAKDDPACDQKVEVKTLTCFICNPSTGAIVTVDTDFAESVEQRQLWEKLAAKETKCEEIKRSDLKKIFTKPPYLSLEKLFNDADKYYSKGAAAKISGNGKKLFKKVDKAPLLSTPEEAKSVYSQVGTHEINKCVPQEVKKRDCKEMYGLDVTVQNLGDAFKSEAEALDAISKANNKKIDASHVTEGNKVSLIVKDEIGNDCGWTATFKEDPRYCGKAQLTAEEKQSKKEACEKISTTIPGTQWNDQDCYCKVGALSFKTTFDTCEFDFASKSFDGVLDVSVTGKTEAKKDWNEVSSKVAGLISAIELNSELHHSCTLNIEGLASKNGLYANCVSYINKASGKNHAVKDYSENSSDPVNSTLGLLRAQKLYDFIKAKADKHLSGSCTADYCGAVSAKPTKVRSDNAIQDQMFNVQYSCEMPK